jgi:CHAD domain-containing protein
MKTERRPPPGRRFLSPKIAGIQNRMARTAPRTAQSAHPIETLREAVTALEAAVLLCLARPGKKRLHKLRISTRRVEAQLTLLSLLPKLPPHHIEADKARRLLRKLRRAAGLVRDIDVQRDLIRNEAAGAPRKLRTDARKLRRALKRQRDREASALLRLLNKQRDRLPRALEDLLSALAPQQSLALTQIQLTALVRKWYAQPSDRQPAPAISPKVSDDPQALHAIRKRAKLARYLAESAPASAHAAHRLAARFEALQLAGGEWHDWLILAEIAADELGDSSELPHRFASHAESALRDFRHHLRYKI